MWAAWLAALLIVGGICWAWRDSESKS